MQNTIPVITIDGPSGSGKGTIGQLLAKKLGWHFLDSGSLYRVLALAALKQQIELTDTATLEKLAINLDVQFSASNNTIRITLCNQEVTNEIRTEECSWAASKIAGLAPIRKALLTRQRNFRQAPGLIADGRDMGTIVFKDAKLKLFLTASQEKRAERRYKQLQEKQIHGSLHAILQDLVARDARDEKRNIAPLQPAPDAIIIDTTELSIEQVMQQVMELYTRGPYQ